MTARHGLAGGQEDRALAPPIRSRGSSIPVCQYTQSVVPALGDDAAALAGQVEVGNVQAQDRPGAPVRSGLLRCVEAPRTL